jgi:uncharacterized protein (TIGR00251 family)
VPEVSDLFSSHDGYVVADVHVQPRAGRTAVVGRHGAALKVRVAAPPVDGRANDAVCALMSEVFGVPPSAVSVVSGGSSRTKRVRVDGVDAEAAGAALRRALDETRSGPPGRESPPRHRG